MRAILLLPSCLSLFLLTRIPAAEDGTSSRSVEDIAQASRAAVVVIASSDRVGEARGAGSGFIVRPDGLVITSLHVIGEGRPFTVRLADGRQLKPSAIAAFDRARDLAAFQVEAKDLPALELGDSDSLRPGQSVLAVGNPLGLGLSVARGAVAGVRELDGRRLIQVAIPIEPGSSGSPLIDLEGKVMGVLAIKSGASTAFAVPSSDLKAFLASPRPVPIERWLKIGVLDPKVWRPVLGGQWRQRAGRIVASSTGDGFGGRMLCLSEAPPPDGDFDLSVEVRLEDEGGAAGLAFHADGGDRHYGFYPTNGSLRLTRFDGPDVFSWTILKTVASRSYRPGEWNTIQVRLRGAKISCSVNGETVIEAEDSGLPRGKVGLCKFREPGAELRRFRAAPELSAGGAAGDLAVKAAELASGLSSGRIGEREAMDSILQLGDAGLRALDDRAASLEKEASRLRALAGRVRRSSVERQLRDALQGKEEDIDLLHAALLLSKLDNPDLEVEPYRELVDRMAREAHEKLEGVKGEGERLAGLIRHLFDDLGFHGSQAEYHHRSNSYVNEVLDDREGIPITLSVVFLEIARRVNVPVAGIGVPRHFLVEHRPAEGEKKLVDVFGGGKIVTRAEAAVLSGESLGDGDLAPATKRQIIIRMLRNLLGAAQGERDADGMLRYLDAIILLDETPEAAAGDRWMRAMLHAHAGASRAALEDLDWLLEQAPTGIQRAEVEKLRDSLRREKE